MRPGHRRVRACEQCSLTYPPLTGKDSVGFPVSIWITDPFVGGDSHGTVELTYSPAASHTHPLSWSRRPLTGSDFLHRVKKKHWVQSRRTRDRITQVSCARWPSSALEQRCLPFVMKCYLESFRDLRVPSCGINEVHTTSQIAVVVHAEAT